MSEGNEPKHVRAVVVGAGFGGLYAAWRLRGMGLTVLGIEKAPDVGGVWYYNRYPGARVDVQSLDYSYHFSEDLYRSWQWTERYAAQPELLAYLRHVADRFGLRETYRFGTCVTSATWEPGRALWTVTTSTGLVVNCNFLIMATGSLSEPRKPAFRGLDDFRGQWVQTALWPVREVPLAGRRVGLIGTGSSGVQVAPELARAAKSLHVFQRSPNYSVPAQNRPLDPGERIERSRDVAGTRAMLRRSRGGMYPVPGLVAKPAADCTPEERQRMLQLQWDFGSQNIKFVFTDQNIDMETNRIVADFVRDKIRARVNDPGLAEQLCPRDHPIGSRRIALDSGYYETFNRDNVALVNLRQEPLERITATGIRTAAREYELDLIVFATGFDAFTGALDRTGIRNHLGRSPTDGWGDGPRTAYGLMVEGFPNLFLPTGPGSPSVLANLVLENEYVIDWIAGAIAHLDRNGLTSIEPQADLVDRWTRHVAEVADRQLRRQVQNYMVHVNADGTRVMIPYVGGLDRYLEAMDASARQGYAGFDLR